MSVEGQYVYGSKGLESRGARLYVMTGVLDGFSKGDRIVEG